MSDNRLSAYGGHGVDIKLDNYEGNGGKVFWSPRRERGGLNSFTIVKDEQGEWSTGQGERVALLCVNGLGEIRWRVMGRVYEPCDVAAVAHFDLGPWQNIPSILR